MCPVTKCPPILLPTRKDDSRLTTAFGLEDPKIVRCEVSGDIAAKKLSDKIFVTVRQMPSTAILSPIAMLCRNDAGLEGVQVTLSVSAPIASIVPVVWMRPVNTIIVGNEGIVE